MAEAQRSWADIPPDLAGLVLARLPAHVDRVRFAAVCPRWRDAAREIPLPPPLPLLLVPDGTVYSLPRSELLRFPDCEGFTCACDNWLVFSRDDRCLLVDPFSKATFTLPALSRFQPCFDGLDVPGDGSFRVPWTHENGNGLALHKIILCSPQLAAAFLAFDFCVGIAVCKPGGSRWSVHRGDRDKPFVDMAFHQGKLYALESYGENLYAINISLDRRTGDPWVSQIQRVIKGSGNTLFGLVEDIINVRMLYLVKSNGALLMVRRRLYRGFTSSHLEEGSDSVDFSGLKELEVFEADFGELESRWAKVTSIGADQVLFLRRRCSRVISVSQYNMPGDHIFFFENGDEDDIWYGEKSSSSCLAYDMKDREFSSPLSAVSWKLGSVFATWLFP